MSVMLFLLHSLNYKLNKINNSINNILIFQLSIVIIYIVNKRQLCIPYIKGVNYA